MNDTTNNGWVVLVTDASDIDNVVCCVVSEAYATEAEALTFADDVRWSNPSFVVEVCTELEAADCVTD